MQCISILQIGNWGVHTASTLPGATEGVSGRAVIKMVIFWLPHHSYRVQTIFPTWLWGLSTLLTVPQNCLNPLPGETTHHHRSANGDWQKTFICATVRHIRRRMGERMGKKCAIIVPPPSSLFLSNLVLDIIRTGKRHSKRFEAFSV